jgi:hypothetical protein
MSRHPEFPARKQEKKKPNVSNEAGNLFFAVQGTFWRLPRQRYYAEVQKFGGAQGRVSRPRKRHRSAMLRPQPPPRTHPKEKVTIEGRIVFGLSAL